MRQIAQRKYMNNISPQETIVGLKLQYTNKTSDGMNITCNIAAESNIFCSYVLFHMFLVGSPGQRGDTL